MPRVPLKEPVTYGEWKERPKTATTRVVDIYMAGDYKHAKQVCRMYCEETPYCFSLTKVDYVYHGGEEEGFKVTLINYPRFPSEHDVLEEHAIAVAKVLAEVLHQGSYTIVSKNLSKFYTRRIGD